MEWQQLEYFQTTAQLEHITRAAEALSISQPALSRSIARLEQELGVSLFERNGRAIVLNRYGKLFLLRVNRIMKEYQEGMREIAELTSPQYGEVSLGFLHTLGPQLVPELIRQFRAEYPHIQFQLHQSNTQTLLDRMMDGDIDLCLTSLRERDTPQQIRWAYLRSEELFVAVPVGHPLAERDAVRLDEVGNEPIVSFKMGYGLRKITDDLFQQAGIQPKVTFEGEEVHTIAGLVASGLGVAVIPDFQGIDRSQVSLLPVEWPLCRRNIGMAWIEGHYLSPAAEQFRQFILRQFDTVVL